jgi:D-xylose transport system ATP-binding protein
VIEAFLLTPKTIVFIETNYRIMFGWKIKERFPKGNHHPGDVILEVKNMHAQDPNDTSR